MTWRNLFASVFAALFLFGLTVSFYGQVTKENPNIEVSSFGSQPHGSVYLTYTVTCESDRVMENLGVSGDSGGYWRAGTPSGSSAPFYTDNEGNGPGSYTATLNGDSRATGGSGSGAPDVYGWSVSGKYKITCTNLCPTAEVVKAIAVKGSIDSVIGQFDSAIHTCQDGQKRHKVNKSGLSSDEAAKLSIKCEAVSTEAAEICCPSKCNSLGTLWVVSTKITVGNVGGTNTGDPSSTEVPKTYIAKDKSAGLSLAYAPSSLNMGTLSLSGLGDKLELYSGSTKVTDTSWNLEDGGVPGNLTLKGVKSGEVTLTLTHSPSNAESKIKVFVCDVEVVIDGVTDKDQKNNPGAFIGVKKRKSLSLKAEPSAAGGNVSLSLSGLDLYDAETGGSAISQREWSVDNLPTGLFVGGAVSTVMLDKEAKLTWRGAEDTAKATVVEGTWTLHSLSQFDKGTLEAGKCYIHWNIDNDDDSDPVVGAPKHPGGDYLQDRYVGNKNDNDLLTSNISLTPDPDNLKIGTVKINVDSNKIWQTQNKNAGSANNLLLSGEQSWDLSNALQRAAFKKFTGAFHEGMNSSKVEYAYEFIPPVGTTIQLTKYSVHNISANCGNQPTIDVATGWGERFSLEPYIAAGVRCQWSVTAPGTSRYNCIAWSVKDDTEWIQPQPATVAGYDAFYKSRNYEPCDSIDEAEILLYQKNGEITHAARRMDGCACGAGKWIMFESKIGGLPRVEHRRNALDGGPYGVPFRYYQKSN